MIATYLGGPLATGILVKKNFESLGQRRNARISMAIGIVATILLLAVIFAIPEHIIVKIPYAAIPLAYTAAIYFIVDKYQGDVLKNHKEVGGEFYSGWKAAGIGAISLLIIGAIGFIAGDLSTYRPDFDAATYDKEFARFVDNENKSLAFYQVIDTRPADYLIREITKGIGLWEENKAIINELNKIENLPIELINQNAILLKYCDLRIQQNEIIINAIYEDTDKYAFEIERIGLEINNIIEELTGNRQ